MLVLLCLFLLPSASAEVDCHMACTHCRDEAEEAALVEVYCAMCRECRERRRERNQIQQELQMRQRNYGWDQGEDQSIPPGCPTPPPCSEEMEELLKEPEPTTCATVLPCKPNKQKANSKIKLVQSTTMPPPPKIAVQMAAPVMPVFMPMYMPCGGMCPCPPPIINPATTPAPLEKMQMVEQETTAKDFFYVYIGLPKDALNKIDK